MQSQGNDDQDAKQARQLVKAAMQHVPFDGWSMAALQMACDDLAGEDLAGDESGKFSDADLDRLLPDGVRSAVQIYMAMTDDEMTDGFAALKPMPDKTHLKIRALILLRLEQGAPHKEVIRKTLSYLARPEQAKFAAELLYATVDRMWRVAGDQATDMSFYSKRATLSAVYSATLLAFLADDSSDMAKTKAFLDKRLYEVSQIPKLTAPVAGAVRQLGRLVQSLAGRKHYR